MINFKQAVSLLEHALKTMLIFEAIEIKTYKKDRSVTLYKAAADQFIIIQHGFKQQQIHADSKTAKTSLKQAIKTEFPRSNMVWMSHFKEVPCANEIGAQYDRQATLF